MGPEGFVNRGRLPCQNLHLEVAPIGQTLRGVGPSQLVEREALRPGADELDARPMRDLETRADLYAPILQLGDGQRQVGYAVDEHGLVALEMTSQEQDWWVGAESNHGHPRPERLDRKHELRAHLISEVLQIGCHVPAGEVYELKRVEHEPEPTLW